MNHDRPNETSEAQQPPFSELMLRWLAEGDLLHGDFTGDGDAVPDAGPDRSRLQSTGLREISPEARRIRVLLAGAVLTALGLIMVVSRYASRTDGSNEAELVAPHQANEPMTAVMPIPEGATPHPTENTTSNAPRPQPVTLPTEADVDPAASSNTVTVQAEPEPSASPSASVEGRAAIAPQSPESLPTPSKPEPESHLRDCRNAVARESTREGLKACTAALAEAPHSVTAMVLLARAHLLGGHAKESLRLAQDALTMDSRLPEAYLLVGSVQQTAGHAKTARSAYEAYLRLSPTGRHASEVRAVLQTL